MSSSMVLTESAQEQVSQTVAQTVYVYDEDFNGTMLSGVQVTGQDAAGNSFEGTTDSNGSVFLSGQPGTWQFTFMKEGYNPLSLNYDVNRTGEGAVYLQKASQSIPQQIQPDQNQSSASTWYQKGIILDEQGKHEEAVEAYDEVLKIDPQCAMAWYNKAAALKKIGRENESEEAFANAKELSYNDSI